MSEKELAKLIEMLYVSSDWGSEARQTYIHTAKGLIAAGYIKIEEAIAAAPTVIDMVKNEGGYIDGYIDGADEMKKCFTANLERLRRKHA
jgi:hypothetical protein